MAGNIGHLFRVDGPLLDSPPYGTMKACGFLDGVEALVRGHGGDFSKVLERHEIDPTALSDSDYAIRCTSAAAILDDCSSRFDDRLFGLHLGDRLQVDVYGALTTYARTAANIRQAIGVLLEYMPVIYCPEADVEFVETAEAAEFRWRPSSDFASDEQANYLGQAQVLKFLKGLIETEFSPATVQVVSEPWRKDLEEMERCFGCKVYGNSSANIVSFPASVLGRRTKGANPMLFGLLGDYFSQVKQSAQRGLVDEVRAYARSSFATGHCTIERCAARLETSARTIQRRLTEEGLRFSEIVEQERIAASERALVQTDNALSDIAYSLGYSDQSSFGRAFKRWTGMTPQAFREQHKVPPRLN